LGGDGVFCVLLAEDDPQIAGLISMTLEIAGYRCIWKSSGDDALEQIQKGGFELALLDVMLPGIDGYGLLAELKQRNVPAIFVTARGEVQDRVAGLRMGAEDYIVKPFEPIELLARVEAALRRLPAEEPALNVGEVSVLPASHTVLHKGDPVQLTPLEYSLLEFLIRHKNIAYSREQLLDAIWGYDFYGNTRTVDMHIQKLRVKLGLEDRIRTIHKMGYRLEG
jgi:DNA-binding response OmpR family regulator